MAGDEDRGTLADSGDFHDTAKLPFFMFSGAVGSNHQLLNLGGFVW